MNVVILHCHFERGGVTQVVENHVRWLREQDNVDRIVLVSGQRTSGLSPGTLEAVTRISLPGFDYDSGDDAGDTLDERCRRMVRDLGAELSGLGISPDDSVLHWHNHSLGKNTAAPAAIRQLAESGYRLLLHIHDFAEDNRPENYRRLMTASGANRKADLDRFLYPVAPQIHYATLTHADASVLAALGVPEAQTHCLPNSVVMAPGSLPSQDEALAKVRRAMNLGRDARWCLYPVRGIRRKNVGEFLLVSRWIGADQFAGLTLCPATPVEKRSYERWKRLASDVAPKAIFDAGHDPNVTFIDNLSAADSIISTSVAEGFGMAFLEPWLVHREVIARRLPTVTDDFEACGVRLPKLYDTLPIPGHRDWIQQCLAESNAAMEIAWSALPESFRPTLDLGIDRDADAVDFARLVPRRQVEVLRKVAADSGYEAAVRERSRDLVRDLNEPPNASLLRHNAEVVRAQYSPQQAGRGLFRIYNALLAATPEHPVQSPCNAGRGVDLITSVRPFYPCRTEVLDD